MAFEVQKPTPEIHFNRDPSGVWKCEFTVPEGQFISPMEITRLQRTLSVKFKEVVRKAALVSQAKAMHAQDVPVKIA